jgi:uncharacterized protein
VALAATRVSHAAPLLDDGLLNPCLDSRLPPSLSQHEVVRAAWDGIVPERVWDVHVHLLGNGDSGGGAWLRPEMTSPWHPVAFLRRLILMNAACARGDMVDTSYVQRLHALAEGLPPGARCMLLAFDHHHDQEGRSRPAQSPFHVPDRYAAAVARAFPGRFEWIASIHPYRPDAVEALAAARTGGARAVKWLPNAMGIDPASSRCDAFYAALARSDTPLLTHAGDEAAVDAQSAQELGNPLRLRRALDHGVRVIVAHCAALGTGVDLDTGPHGPRVPNLALFARLMDEPGHGSRLHGDLSALVQRNRAAAALPRLLARADWHPRLLWGSDYPLPGVLPLISAHALAEQGLLAPAEVPVLVEIRRYNPLLFDFVLKRRLTAGGRRFAPSVFETRGFFTGTGAR